MSTGLPVCMQVLPVNSVRGQGTRFQVMINGLPVCMQRLPVNGVLGQRTRLEVMSSGLLDCVESYQLTVYENRRGIKLEKYHWPILMWVCI
jgi:hypothetical protein